jgi:hypothetical protein
VIITEEFVQAAGGPRSAYVRSAMVQAGDKHRVGALMDFLLSVGSCALTLEDAAKHGLKIYEKNFSFMGSVFVYSLLDKTIQQF